MTTTEIAAEHGVSRQTIHTYRRTGVFPQPVEGQGSTRPRFRADEVAAFFAANPKQPGVKRTPSKQQGEPVTTTTADARRELYAFAMQGKEHSPEISQRASEKIDAFRRAVLREAADRLDESEVLRDLTDDHMGDIKAATNELRRMADESGAQDG
ncbi:helix-turn-helix transcriptional regulator [Streptomyces sp. NPDC020490]|uniref:helix-turn-helix transcriptional regulator n=1 Tax=Streptomyces sp. NPDC020490 TaxID=3365078 RepID=UPI00378CA096